MTVEERPTLRTATFWSFCAVLKHPFLFPKFLVDIQRFDLQGYGRRVPDKRVDITPLFWGGNFLVPEVTDRVLLR